MYNFFMNETKTCPKCKDEMEEGTFGGLYGSMVPWARGKMFLKWISSNNASKDVKVYCCKKCGYLESFGQ